MCSPSVSGNTDKLPQCTTSTTLCRVFYRVIGLQLDSKWKEVGMQGVRWAGVAMAVLGRFSAALTMNSMVREATRGGCCSRRLGTGLDLKVNLECSSSQPVNSQGTPQSRSRYPYLLQHMLPEPYKSLSHSRTCIMYGPALDVCLFPGTGMIWPPPPL